MGISLRFIEPRDFAEFSRWAATNPDIPAKDIEAALRNNTTVVLVAEEDGKALMYLPFYCMINVAFFGFNPESDAKERLRAMQAMLPGVKKFAELHGINDIQGFSKKDYLMAKWAEHSGFREEDRQAFVLSMPRK